MSREELAAAERDYALWLHAESEWWLAQYKHDVVLWRKQVDELQGRIDEALAECADWSLGDAGVLARAVAAALGGA